MCVLLYHVHQVQHQAQGDITCKLCLIRPYHIWYTRYCSRLQCHWCLYKTPYIYLTHNQSKPLKCSFPIGMTLWSFQFGIGFQLHSNSKLESFVCLIEKCTGLYSISNLELDSNWIPIPNWNDHNASNNWKRALKRIIQILRYFIAL